MKPESSDRQRRERAFYSVYSHRYAGSIPDLAPVDPTRPGRPWNPYWYCYRRILDLRGSGASRLLDLGCGWGDMAIPAAVAGFNVFGVDITPENIAIARERAAGAGVEGRTRFTVGAAEQLPYTDAFFDVVAGIDILHHVDVIPTVAACHRVLRPGGRILFKEPVWSPVFDPVRNTALVRRFFPNEKSLDRHITEDERKLDSADLASIRSAFPTAEFRWFRFLARADRVLRLRTFCEKLDMVLLNRVGLLHALAGFVVVEAVKENGDRGIPGFVAGGTTLPEA